MLFIFFYYNSKNKLTKTPFYLLSKSNLSLDACPNNVVIKFSGKTSSDDLK